MESPHPTLLVPTHLFKIVLVIDSRRDKPRLGCYIVPNSPTNPNQHQLRTLDIPRLE